MIATAWLLFVATASLGGPAVPDAQELLATARGLYAEAAYEEALEALNSAESVEPAAALDIERYRALCLFALGQPDAARAALAKIVERDPLYVATQAEAPPRLVTMLHEVRRELLPGIARRSYAEVRSELAAGKTAAAAPALERIVRMTSDPDVSGVEGMEDLRLLADGFLVLAAASAQRPAQTTAPQSAASQTAGSQTGTPQAPPAQPATDPTANPVGTVGTAAAPDLSRPTLFTAADTEVVPPQPIDQDFPVWSTNRGPRTGMTFSGYLRLIVDESGNVSSADMLRAIHPAYDYELLRAAKDWRFVAAQKDGKPVKYLKVMRITIKDM